MGHKTKVTRVTSEPVQYGDEQVLIENTAVYVMVDADLETLLRMLTQGYELQGAFPWGEMTIAIVRTVKPSGKQNIKDKLKRRA